MFCCRSSRDATKAVIFSGVGQIVTILMLMVGAALFVFYQQFPPNAVEAALFAQKTDYVFPVWITTVLPPGITVSSSRVHSRPRSRASIPHSVRFRRRRFRFSTAANRTRRRITR
jgi:hypothetical protein